MRYGVISDIHGNLEALETMLKFMRREGVDKYLFLGDIVGYGADPGECIEIVSNLPGEGVAGNHDWGVLGLTPLEYFNNSAVKAVEWTREVLTDTQLGFLEKLPLVVEREDFTLVHATLEMPEEWRYIYSTYEAHRNIEMMKSPVCFCGHTHMPIYFVENKHITFGKEEIIELQEKHKYLVNVGSVGQPRDNDSRACGVIYDTEKGRIEYIRQEYDISRAQEKIWKAGLPEFLGTRLQYGE